MESLQFAPVNWQLPTIRARHFPSNRLQSFGTDPEHVELQPRLERTRAGLASEVFDHSIADSSLSDLADEQSSSSVDMCVRSRSSRRSRKAGQMGLR